MPESPLRLIAKSAEFIPKEDRFKVPRELRGIYVLYECVSPARRRQKAKYDVLYVGMTAAGRKGGIRSRLVGHARSRRKGKLWTHFSVFAVWDNIRDEEVAELEGLFRHIYRRDTKANRLNVQRGFKKMRLVRNDRLHMWAQSVRHN